MVILTTINLLVIQCVVKYIVISYLLPKLANIETYEGEHWPSFTHSSYYFYISSPAGSRQLPSYAAFLDAVTQKSTHAPVQDYQYAAYSVTRWWIQRVTTRWSPRDETCEKRYLFVVRWFCCLNLGFQRVLFVIVSLRSKQKRDAAYFVLLKIKHHHHDSKRGCFTNEDGYWKSIPSSADLKRNYIINEDVLADRTTSIV